MAVDMKGMMADAVAVLLFEKNKKKITVKDIVEECNITRQAFYYHFADIPELLQWMMDQKADELFREMGKLNTPEDYIRYWILIGINGKKQLKKGMESNYGKEIEAIVFEEMVNVFTKIVEQHRNMNEIDSDKKRRIIRYHCHGVVGLLKEWTEQDSEHLDEIVHDIFRIVCGGSGDCCDNESLF